MTARKSETNRKKSGIHYHDLRIKRRSRFGHVNFCNFLQPHGLRNGSLFRSVFLGVVFSRCGKSTIHHQEFQVPNMEALNLIRLLCWWMFFSYIRRINTAYGWFRTSILGI